MNLLITGGRGGIGQELCAALGSREDVKIITLSRREAPPDATLPANTIHETGSVLDAGRLRQILAQHRITHIIHAAGARTRECEADLRLAREANVSGTETVFHAAQAAGGVKRILHLSTAAVYGHCAQRVTESQPPAPATNYAITKASSEIVARRITETAEFQTVILRPGFVIGPRTGGSLNRFIAEAAQGRSPVLRFIEHFFHLHWAPDLATAMLRLLDAPLREKVSVYHPPGHDVSIHAFAAAVQKTLGQTSALRVEVETPSCLPARLDSSRFQKEIGGMLITPLTAMVRRLVDVI